MSTINEPIFDESELDRVLSQFEHSGPAIPDGVDDFCRAFESWIDQADPRDEAADAFRADLLFIRGMLDTARGDYKQAIENLHDSIQISKTCGNVRRHIFGLCSIATCFEYAGMQTEASNSVLDALNLAEDLGDDRIHAAVLHCLSSLYEAQGSYEQMLESTLRTHAIIETLDDRQLSLRSYSAVGLAYGHLHRANEGLEWLMKALDLIDHATPRFVSTYLNMNLMYLHRRGGRIDEAVILAEEHVDHVAELPAQHAAVLYVDLAELHLAVGNLDRAGEMLVLADQISDPAWMKAHLLGYYKVAADLHKTRSEPESALEMLQLSMQLEAELRGRQAQARLVALERHFAAELVAKTDELHYLRTVELVEKNNQLSELIQKNDEILDVVVNDLRNPLAATRLLTDLLLTEVDDPHDERAVHLVQSIKSATVEMSGAIERLVAEVRPNLPDPSGESS